MPRIKLTALAALVLTATFAVPIAYAQSVIYVDDDARLGGTGADWEHAFRYLQDALSVATSGDEVRVADGTYTPDQDEAGSVTAGDREATFQLISGLVLRGGFRGCPAGYCGGGDPNEQVSGLCETILSGDLEGNDDPVADPADMLFEPTRATNAYHVVTADGIDATAILVGFTVADGNANGSLPERRVGGGMYNMESHVRLTNCTFKRNSAFVSGGMYTRLGSPTLVNCTFAGNVAEFGGGMYNSGTGAESYSPTLVNCTFSGNVADNGGGIYNFFSSPTLTNCILWGNEFLQMSGDLAVVKYSCVQGGWPGDGNTSVPPLFVDADGLDDIPGTEDDNLRLSPGSPSINTGDPAFVPEPGETDLDGHIRVLCGRVDMGAFEFGIGDFDCDRGIDLADFAGWAACMTGSGQGPYTEGCQAFDFDHDGDVDLYDSAGFLRAFTGTGP